MKYLLPIFIIFITSFFSNAQTLILSDPIQVADNDLYGKTRPRIAVNGSGQPVVMWSQNATKKVFVNSMASGQFGTPVQVNTDGVQAFVANWAGPDMGSYGDTVFVTYHSTPENTGKVYVHKSVDGGLTFGDSVRVDHPLVDQSRFPSVTVKSDGNPVVGFMKFEGNYLDPGYVVANSIDGGATFQQEVEGSWAAQGEVCDCCPAQVVTSGDKQAIMFRNNDDNIRDAWVSVSADNGATFPLTLDVDNNNWMVNSCPSSGPDGFISGDSLYTTWMSEGTGDTRIFISSISNVAGTIGHFNLVRDVPFDGTTENFPRMDGDGQNMAIVYQTWKQGETDCYITASQTGVTGLGDTLRLGATQDGAQRYPDIAFSDGVYHIVYDDSEAGHIMYQTAFWGNVGIEESTLQSNVWSAGKGNLEIRVSEAGRYQVNLTNSLGQIIAMKKSSGSSLTMNQLPSGLIHVQILKGEKRFIQTIFVE